MEIMKFDQVYKTFQENGEVIEALKPTSFTLYAGEVIAVIGPSGSGKSTLLTMMGGLQRPTGGQILFNGVDLANMSEPSRNQLRFDKIGFVLQTSNLVPFLTLDEQFELVDRFANRSRQQAESDALLEKMGILERKQQYPNDLSGGERQRAAIARALYMAPDLLLADEPTASLDTKKAMEVMALLKSFTVESQRTTVIVTHDERLLEACHRAFKVVDGILTEIKLATE